MSRIPNTFAVAQIFNLLYRRFAICPAPILPASSNPPDRQIENLRYSRLKLCATVIAAAALVVLQASAGESPAPTNSKAPANASSKLEDLFPDNVVARGKGFEIKRSQLDARVIELKSSNLARGTPAPPELEQQVLQKLIGIGLLVSKATEADKTKSQELSTKRLETAKKSAGSEETFQRQLKSVGMSEEEFRNQVTEETTAETVAER